VECCEQKNFTDEINLQLTELCVAELLITERKPNMIYSMTAFARIQHQGEWGSLVCEIRSINHRYLEISMYLPDLFKVLEMPMRENIREVVKRGKIECSIRHQPSTKTADSLFTINTQLAQALCAANECIASLLHQVPVINTVDILRYPGVLETKDSDGSAFQQEVFNLLKQSLRDLVSAREREGEELKQLFFQRLDLLQLEMNKVRARLPHVQVDQRDRLLKRFAEAKIEVDPNRFEQEMVMFIQKMDVTEEIERTAAHITEMRRILQQGGVVGRRLDFLLQELNREANTLGSKSVDATITHAAVEMKVLIEQIREQVQNVE
jgi:uncharacterized protein (TIGR00255 family)